MCLRYVECCDCADRDLRREDQTKIRKALAICRIDPSDVPDTAKVSDNKTVIPSSSKKKRKAEFDSQSTSQLDQEVADIDLTQEEVRDEIYCALTTKIVGVQYYKGTLGLSPLLPAHNMAS